MTAFAELDLAARTDQLEKAVAEIRKIGVEGDKAGAKVEKATGGMEAGMKKLATAAGFVLGSIVSMQTATAALASARQFDAALAETSTLLAGNAEQMKIVEAGARSLAREFGGNATSQVQAYYQAISAGAGDAAAATRLLDSANRLAKGGVTDVTTAVDVLTTATNAYKASGLTAAEASDALFVGMKAGKTTITELSAAVGGVLPLAVSLGVSFDETVAAMSALTTQGISTAQAATGVRAALTSMIAPTDEAAKLAATLGIEFSAAGVQANGFGGVMDQIIQKTGGNTAMIQKLFGSVEATTAALSFAGGAGTVYGAIMDQMTEKAGATSEAFDIVASSLNERLNVVLAQGADLLLGFGQALLTVIVPALETGVALFDAASGSMEVFAVIATGLAFTQMPALVAALGAKAVALLAGASAAGIATTAMVALNAAVTFLGGPIGIALGAVAALGAAMFLTTTRATNLGGASDEMNRALQKVPGMADGAAGGVSRSGTAAYDAAGKFDDFTGAVGAARGALGLWMDEYLAASGLDPISTPMGITISPPGSPESMDELRNYLGGGTPGEPMSPLAPGASPRPQRPGINSYGDFLDANKGSAGGSGGGGGDDGFQGRLDALVQELETEREILDQWYEESQEVLADRRALEILGEEGHREALLSVEEEYQRRMSEIQDAAFQKRISDAAGVFGALADIASAGGAKSAKAVATFQAIEGTINAYGAAIKALNTPGITLAGRFAAYSSVLAAGLKGVQAIRSAGGASGGGAASSVGGGSRDATAQPAQQERIVRLDVRGDGMFADMLRESGSAIIDAVLNEKRAGGTTVIMARS